MMDLSVECWEIYVLNISVEEVYDPSPIRDGRDIYTKWRFKNVWPPYEVDTKELETNRAFWKLDQGAIGNLFSAEYVSIAVRGPIIQKQGEI